MTASEVRCQKLHPGKLVTNKHLAAAVNISHRLCGGVEIVILWGGGKFAQWFYAMPLVFFEIARFF